MLLLSIGHTGKWGFKPYWEYYNRNTCVAVVYISILTDFCSLKRSLLSCDGKNAIQYQRTKKNILVKSYAILMSNLGLLTSRKCRNGN